MRVLVLGAYGLIGAEITRRLKLEGAECRGLVRSLRKAAQLLPGVPCVKTDISTMTDPQDWRELVENCDAVINASGALQTGLRDNLGVLHDRSIRALIEACERSGPKTFIQISAPGAEPDADTEFMRSKGRADAALRASKLAWVIFKPGLVVSRNAYGGTALIRVLAAFPGIQPLVLADAKIQTVAIEDVADAAVLVLKGRVPLRQDYDLVENNAYRLGELVVKFRVWMGFNADAPQVVLPKAVGFSIAKIADIAGWLGWRAPLRSTALRVLKMNVVGDPKPWREATARALQSLDETLARNPATLQERIFARAQLFYPIALVALAAVFVASGVIGLWRMDAAARVLGEAVSSGVARMLVIGGSLLDIGLGLALLARSWAVAAAVGMIALSCAYLVFGAVLTPHLWSDPMGPLIKIIPVMVLAAAIALLTVER